MSSQVEKFQGTGLPSLDPISIERISCFFDSYEDVFSLSLVCKKLEWTRYSPRIWSYVLNNKYGFNVTAHNFEPLKELCKSFTDIDQLLRFVGLYTDGGTDQNLMKYWLDYAFSPHDWLYYCSEVGQNINCVAVLGGLADGSHPLDARYVQYRESLLDICRPLEHLGNRLNNMGLQELENTCREIGNAMEINGAIANIILQELSSHEQRTARRNQIRRVIQQLEKTQCPDYNIQDFSVQSGDKNLCLLDTENMACVHDGLSLRNLAAVKSVSFQRNSNFTCPVATGVVFMGMLQNMPHDLTPEHLCIKIQGMLDSDSCKMFDEMKDQPSLEEYPVVKSGRSFAGCWAEFDANWFNHTQHKNVSALCTLKPVAWFHFYNMEEANQYWMEYRKQEAAKYVGGALVSGQFEKQMPYNMKNEQDLKGRELLEIPLTQKWIGNVMALKLIHCENLMRLFYDNHPYPNIDIRNVKIHGSLIQSPDGVIVHDEQS
eukprot:TRINITY_DN4366_c0_g1_i6.p1 TRINITY_DN4366_c0_g1~~TRINITY_DN4366_c0_g1_i6.p1  ORF type:complete len:488 (+),score=64.01 TRINITY_DN4366_c0_g1_i6:122-1585(+)